MMPTCRDSRKCFAKKHSDGRCEILKGNYKDGECPFCKPKKDWTGEHHYPFDPQYGERFNRL